MYRGPIVLPLALIALGVALLLANFGYLDLDLLDLARRFWPLLLVLIGLELILGAALGRRGLPRAEQFSVELPGSLRPADRAEIKLVFGAGRLMLGRAAAGMLVDGMFDGTVRLKRHAPLALELSLDDEAWWSGVWRAGGAHWDVGLSGELPLQLTLETGASRSELDLRELQLAGLVVQTGASETFCRLPPPAGRVPIRLEVGAASFTLRLPENAQARVTGSLGLGSLKVDRERFTRLDSDYVSSEFESATDRYEISVSGGAGSVSIS